MFQKSLLLQISFIIDPTNYILYYLNWYPIISCVNSFRWHILFGWINKRIFIIFYYNMDNIYNHINLKIFLLIKLGFKTITHIWKIIIFYQTRAILGSIIFSIFYSVDVFGKYVQYVIIYLSLAHSMYISYYF